MNTVSIEYVIRAAKKNGCMVWKMWDAAGELLDRQDSATVNIDQAMTELRNCYNEISGEFVTVQVAPRILKKGGDQTTNVYKYKVLCKESAAAPAVSGINTKGAAADIYSQLISLNVQLAENRKDMEIQRLQRELDEQKAGSGKNSRNKLLERYLEKIFIDSEKKAVNAIAGTQTQTTEQNKTAAEQKPAATAADKKQQSQALVKGLQELQSVDADLVNSIQKLAKFAKANPEQYKQYLQML